MKKIAVIIAVISASLIFAACASRNVLYNNLSELRDNIFRAADENYIVNCYTGFRETKYAQDGVIANTERTFYVKVEPLFEFSAAQEFSVTVTAGGENFSAPLVQHYDNEYFTASLKIDKVIEKSFDVTVFCEGESSTLKAENVTKGKCIGIDKALDITSDELSETIEINSVDGKFAGEIHARLIDIGDQYYWYIGVITPSAKTHGLLINAIDGTVAAKKDFG